MMKNKKRLLTTATSLVCLAAMLTGCGSSAELQELKSTQSLATQEANESTNYNLTYAEEQEYIYSQVVDRTLLDTTKLSKCDDNQLQQVVNYMDDVDAQLTGQAAYDSELVVEGHQLTQSEKEALGLTGYTDTVIDSRMTDYLLAFFEKTPYYWQRTNLTVRGVDAESGAIITDVTYKTIDFDKEVRIDSGLVLGEPNYNTKEEARYNHWMNILAQAASDTTGYLTSLQEFETIYGPVDDIIASQHSKSLTYDIYQSGNQVTSTGLIDNEAEEIGGTCTVRYVLIPNYKMGINLGITCQHMYITDFRLNSDYTDGMTLFTDSGYATVAQNIEDVIYRYFTCMDEHYYGGMYKLTDNFGNIDKYYYDMFNTTYTKHDNFTVSIFDIQGTEVKCGVSASVKERAIGSDMTFPIYTDRYYVTMELIDEELKIKDFILLSRVLEGEPDITTKTAETDGFDNLMDLTDTDKLAIEHLIVQFGILQLHNDTSSDVFGKTVDLSMSTNALESLKASMLSHDGARKATWLTNYQQGNSGYARVKCKELYQQPNNSIVETEATYQFIVKGNTWYIYGYNVNKELLLDTTNLTTNNALCVVNDDSDVEEAYTSMITGSVEDMTTTSSDISYSIDYPEETPTLKNGVKEQGKNLENGKELSEEAKQGTLENVCTATSTNFAILNDADSIETLNTLVVNTENPYTVTEFLDKAVEIYYNIVNNNYTTQEERDLANAEFSDMWYSMDESFKLVKGCFTSEGVPTNGSEDTFATYEIDTSRVDLVVDLISPIDDYHNDLKSIYKELNKNLGGQ